MSGLLILLMIAGYITFGFIGGLAIGLAAYYVIDYFIEWIKRRGK